MFVLVNMATGLNSRISWLGGEKGFSTILKTAPKFILIIWTFWNFPYKSVSKSKMDFFTNLPKGPDPAGTGLGKL